MITCKNLANIITKAKQSLKYFIYNYSNHSRFILFIFIWLPSYSSSLDNTISLFLPSDFKKASRAEGSCCNWFNQYILCLGFSVLSFHFWIAVTVLFAKFWEKLQVTSCFGIAVVSWRLFSCQQNRVLPIK